jgi:hypothetical protein
MKNKLSLYIVAATLWMATSVFGQVSLIAPNATWRYLDTGADQGAAWKNSGFDDATWKSGTAEFGYGDGDETTVLSYGPDINTKYPTYYFRHTFNVANPNAFSSLTMVLNYDDGAVVYVNGTEVYRISMPAGPVTYATLATTAADYTPETVGIPASALVAGANTIAVEVHQANGTSTDISFSLQLSGSSDVEAPTLFTADPPDGAIVNALPFIGVLFSENVTGVDASDLTINGVPATGITVVSPREYQFTFSTPATGSVQVVLAAGGIADLAPAPNPFAGANWTYTYDPNAVISRAIISEFMADNENGIEDEDGTRGDWIEIYNPGPSDVDLGGWSLTDSPTNFTKWRFPSMNLAANRYLLVFASEKNRTNAASPLHTNFRIGRNAGGYLALVNAAGVPTSVFASYPAQVTDNSYGRDRVDANLVGYFVIPTPGAQNSTRGIGFSAEPVINFDNGVYTNNSLLVTITAPAGAIIRYTTNGSEPTNTTSGTAYTGPITISGNTLLKARVFQAGLWPSAVVARNYILIDSTMRAFSSNLPLVIITTPGGIPASVPPGGTRMRGSVAVYDTFRGRANISAKPDFIGAAQFETFGQTSEGFPKKPYNIELNDEYGNDRAASILGMPAEADWKMRNPYSDKCLMNDFLAYEMFEQMGNYSCRRRFVEVFVNTAAGTKLNYQNNYHGVLVFLEKIEIDKDRVNIAELTPSHTNEPSISGGYIFKRDKGSTGDLDFSTAIGTPFKLHDPKPREVNNNVNHPQVQWLRNYISTYEASVSGAGWQTRTGTNHYSNYIDVDSFVDSHWIVEFPKQIDGYRISNFFSKDRGGKIKNVPIWDWNLSFGNADYLEGGRTNGWYYPLLGAGDHVFLRTLVGTDAATGDIDFKQKVVDRWSVLRTNVMNDERVLSRIDEIASLLGEAAVRNYDKYRVLGTYLWPNPNGGTTWHVDYVRPTNYSGIISEMKKWTKGRYLWVDSQFVRSPDFSNPGGNIPGGFSLTITATNPIYYTLNGTDPRAPGGAIAAGAQLYSGPIPITANARVFARARAAAPTWQGINWSGPRVSTYVTATPKLVITELMYNPLPPPVGSQYLSDDFEYLEVKNIGTTPLNLQRYRIRGGLDYEFPNVSLNAGQVGVIVANTAAFQSRYGSGGLILGQYTNRLGNEGDHLVLEGSMQEPILDFDYKDGWYPVTDGLGFSLVIANENAPATNWGIKQGWRASGTVSGSPSQVDPSPPAFPSVVVNEILTHTDLPTVDAIELANIGLGTADISYWYLSDDLKTPKKYRFPAGTTIPAGGYLTINEGQFNANPGVPPSFSLSSLGDEVYLYSGDAAGNLTGYIQGFDFGAQRNGVTFGRYITSTGGDQYVAQSTATLNGQNAGPLVGPIVISEINYQPVDVAANGAYWNNTEDEYIELHNITGNSVPLFDPGAPANTWRLRDAVSFTFPAGVTIPAGGYIIVSSVNANDPAALAAFRSRNRIPAGTLVFGPWDGALDNAQDSVELVRPDAPNLNEVPYVLADKVNYSNFAPWPGGAGIGASLQRVTPSEFGNDPINWRLTVTSPGEPTPTGSAPVITQNPQNTTALETRTATMTVAATGAPPLQFQWHFEGYPIYGATSTTLVLDNLQLNQSGSYGCYVLSPGGVVSSTTATLTVLPAARILEQPKDISARVRPDPAAAPTTNVSFSVNVSTVNPPLTYQWRYNDANIPGATAEVLTINNVTTNNYGRYDCVITDANGTIYSQAGTLYPLVNPVILVAPIAQSVAAGSVVSLSVQYSGFPGPFTNEWRQGSAPVYTEVTEGNTSVYTFTAAAPAPSTNTYRVVIRNRANAQPGVPSNPLINVISLADMDGDGIPDSVETALGLNPNDPADASGDLDGDSMSNLEEQIAGTNPQDPNSYLKVTQSLQPGVANITFHAIAGRTYRIQYSDDLTGPWQKLADVPAKTTERDETVPDSSAKPNRFYRIATPGGL